VDLLLAGGADVNAMSAYGGGPLHMAAGVGDSSLVALLIAKGADPNARDRNEAWTPLHHAVFHRQRGIVALLLADSVLVNERAHRGYTPLHMTAELGDAGMAKMLLAYGADPNARTMAGRTPLHEAA